MTKIVLAKRLEAIAAATIHEMKEKGVPAMEVETWMFDLNPEDVRELARAYFEHVGSLVMAARDLRDALATELDNPTSESRLRARELVDKLA